MSTITKEQLRKRARQKVKSLEFAVTQTAFSDTHAELEEELELARIALASLEAEPAGYHVIKECGAVGCTVATLKEAEETRDFWNKNWTIKPYFYTAPPAPVSVPDEEQCKPHPVMAVKGELGFLDNFDRIISERDEDIDIGQLGSGNCEALMLAALDAFRAAMLQGAERVSNRDELTDAVNGLFAVMDEYPESLVPINRDSAVVRQLRVAAGD
ncbi:hypothetical protein KC310_06225 [Enterobacter hormaechei subsp. xiangfangensis]|uniref:hypothetical protein n=1 Tax=Enterobacter hormaechei TaxID=158836 RepID=UPI00255F04B0|nr:hypothetical protein [Enterobacter hormaechei]MDL4067411.1 hypothetical protein [Enterobacter hormaechei subsp. xiangfangensis]MDR9999269.1 hypothetical protein [Enterobacter hormaechei subsp. xiangfangensis]